MAGLLYKELRLTRFVFILFLISEMIFWTLLGCLFGLSDDDVTLKAFSLVAGLFIVISTFFAGIVESGIFSGEERKKWAYYVASTPVGVSGYIGAKYVTTLIFSMAVVLLHTLVLSAYSQLTGRCGSLTLLVVALFYIQLFMRSVEIPLVVRFGNKTGNSLKLAGLLAILIVGVVYMLFGDTSVFNNMDNFWEWLFSVLKDRKKLNTLILSIGIMTVAVLPLYYLSYRLSVKWYLKGAENYAK
ncbi:ABC-2 transporter permease [Ruminococcus flavefaciens]|uniref:ABC-2 transporter permease n=1 Tax=Ruminococcus flavefaciens TaxID=1265 RepID=UPI0002D64EF0|nr:ABC-2 transporter permease [Ruminococcus flavefaciens]